MSITIINSNGSVQYLSYEDSLIEDVESDIAHASFNREFEDARTDNTAWYSHPIEWTRDLTHVDVMIMMGEIKGYIAGAGAIFNGIQVSIVDKKAIVSMRVPTTTLAVSVVEAINNIACNAS